jgi:hypothetical protein
MAKAKSARPRVAGQGLADQADGARVDGLGAAAPVLAADGVANPVRGAQGAHQVDAGVVGFLAAPMGRIVDVLMRPSVE